MSNIAEDHPDRSTSPRPRKRGCLSGCLLALVVPLVVVVGILVLRPDPLLQTWLAENGEQIAVSPSGDLLAVPVGPLETLRTDSVNLSARNMIELRHISDQRLVRSFKAFFVLRIVFSPDGQLIATVGGDNVVRLYQVADGAFVRSFADPTNDERTVIFSPDGRFVAAGSLASGIHIWRVSDSALVQTLPLEHSAHRLAFSPDGRLLAVAEELGEITVWRLSDSQQLRRLEMQSTNILVFSPDGEYLAVGGVGRMRPPELNPHSGEAQLWRLSTDDPTPAHIFQLGEFVSHLAFSPDGQFLAAGEYYSTGSPLGDWDFWPSRRIQLWRVADGGLVQRLWTPHKEISGLSFTSDGQRLIAHGVDRDWNGNISIWRVDRWGYLWDWLVPISGLLSLLGVLGWWWRGRRQ